MADDWAAFRVQPSAPAADPWADFRVKVEEPARQTSAEGSPTRITVRPQDARPDRGVVDASARGLASGLSANFGDELRGLVEASGANPDDPASVYSLLHGALKYWSGDTDAKKRYDEAVKRERELNKAAEEQHPVASIAGNVAGALALPVGAIGQAATLPGRMAAGAGVGAAFGAASGAGEGVGAADSLAKAGIGAAAGGVLGGVAPAVIEGVGYGARALSAPIVNQLRGAVNPDAEAGRRIVTALQRDAKADPNAVNRLTPAEFAAEPTARIADVGGELTRRLADSAAITSPEGGNALKSHIADRFAGQTNRVVDWLNKSFNFPDALATQRAIDQVEKTVNNANYGRAYKEGNRPLWDETLQNLTAAPDMQTAIRESTKIGANDAVIRGFKPPVNPFSFAADGTMTMKPGVHPTLQFWDYVKRALGGKIGVAVRSGDNTTASQLTQLKNALVSHLDNEVGSYKAARQGAAAAFGAEDALEAGKKFVSSKMGNGEARQALAKMTPLERQIFQDGFTSQYIAMLREAGDNRSILNKINVSPAAQERMEMVLGRTKANELEAKLRVESIMDRLRTAVTGNSWTAQRLYGLGLAGGAGVGLHGSYNMDPKEMTYGALVGALASGGKKIDQRVAQRVAEMLMSRDPKVLSQGFNLVSRDSGLMAALRHADNKIAGALGEQGAGASALVQMPAIGRANDQPNAPRPPGQ